jgi:Mg/Co/Ni transporter MgtE
MSTNHNAVETTYVIKDQNLVKAVVFLKEILKNEPVTETLLSMSLEWSEFQDGYTAEEVMDRIQRVQRIVLALSKIDNAGSR